jgi:hypothetical protein
MNDWGSEMQQENARRKSEISLTPTQVKATEGLAQARVVVGLTQPSAPELFVPVRGGC